MAMENNFVQSCTFSSFPSHLCLRQPLEAARLLARRADLPSICTALDVCLAARETSAAATYAKKYVQQTLLVLDWPAADQVAGMDEKLQALRLQVHVHESLVRQLHFLGCLEDAFVAGAKWLPDELPASKDSEEGKLPGECLLYTPDGGSQL